MSQGSWDQAKDADIFVRKEWLAFEDEATRDSHLDAMAMGAIPIDEPFTNQLMYPLEPGGAPGEVINCRCTLVYYSQDES
jgi:hypothetical protein